MIKRCLVEGIGTFFLAFAVAMTSNPFTAGLMLMAMIYMGGHVSGGHFNPAVSLSVFLRRRLSAHDLLAYAGAQTAGAFLAMALYRVTAGASFVLPAYPAIWVGVMYEGIAAFALCVVVLEVLTCARFKIPELAGLIIGLTLVGLAFLPAVLNPAIILGALVSSLINGTLPVTLGASLLHAAYPLVGAVAAAYVFNYIDR